MPTGKIYLGDTLISDPGAGGGGSSEDADAAGYLNAVEWADGQGLEPAVRTAVNTFVVGCKSDGNWDAIEASCILAGARTLEGALTPLKKDQPKPTNENFVGGDYDRETGLVGNGSNKRLNTGVIVSDLSQDDCHIASYLHSGGVVSLGDNASTAGENRIVLVYSDPVSGRCMNSDYSTGTIDGSEPSFVGFSRSTGASFTASSKGSSETITTASSTPTANPIHTHHFSITYYASRVAFYSLGAALDIAALDARVTTLIADIAAAIP